MKKIDVTTQLTLLSGSPIMTKTEQGETVGTLRYALIESLLHPEADSKEMSGEMKLRKFLLAEKVHKAEQFLELDNDEIKLVEPCIPKVFHTLIAGQVLRLLK